MNDYLCYMFVLQGKIIDFLKKGKEDDAIKVLYKEVFPKIIKFIKKNGGSREDAEDVFQDGVSAFYKQWHLGNVDTDKDLESYIFIICKNLWLHLVKKKNKIGTFVDIETQLEITADDDIIKAIITDERKKHIESLMDSLGEKCKEMLTMSVFHQKSMEEIALTMNYANENAAKSTNYRCKQKLISLLNETLYLKNWIRHE